MLSIKTFIRYQLHLFCCITSLSTCFIRRTEEENTSVYVKTVCTKRSCSRIVYRFVCTRIIYTKLSVFSPQWFQLSTFCAGWFSSAIIFFPSGVSTANLSCWVVLIRCNLSFSSGVSAAIVSRSRVLLCCEVA